MRRFFSLFTAISALLTWVLVGLGAVVRLKGAGLACPDWPLCFGEVVSLGRVLAPGPDGVGISLEVGHRYLAGGVSVLFVVAASLVYLGGEKLRDLRWFVPAGGVLLVIQVILGALTIFLRLSPVIVALHLLTGTLFFGTLLVAAGEAATSRRRQRSRPVVSHLRRAAGVALAITLTQLFLGGFVSGSGASLACPVFPGCETFLALPTNYLESLQMLHRTMAIFVAIAVGVVALVAWRSRAPSIEQWVATAVLVLVLGQILLGWYNVAHRVPVTTAALHTMLGASIAAGLMWMVATLRRRRRV